MSAHHTHDPICPLCEEKAKDAHPLLQTFWGGIKKQFPDAHLSWTYRNEEMQELFFQEGKTRVRWPGSAHNKTPARAMDLFQLRPDGVPSWSPFYFKQIFDWLKSQGAPIDWGGTWKSLGDGDHFELRHDAEASTPN